MASMASVCPITWRKDQKAKRHKVKRTGDSGLLDPSLWKWSKQESQQHMVQYMVQHMVQDMVQHIRLIPSALKKVQPPATSFSRSSKVKAAPKKIWADAWANGLKPSKTHQMCSGVRDSFLSGNYVWHQLITQLLIWVTAFKDLVLAVSPIWRISISAKAHP